MVRLIQLAAAAVLVVQLGGSAVAQDFSYEFDNSGKGAVLCGWVILVAIQATTEACGWSRIPTDDAIDAAIADTEKFILENSSSPITQEMIDAKKQRDNRHTFSDVHDALEMCSAKPEDMVDWMAGAWMFRQNDAAVLTAGVKDSLSVPREPVMNPCL